MNHRKTPRPHRALVLVTLVQLMVPTLLSAQYVTTADLLSLEPVPPDHVLSYGPDELQFGHLRLPEGEGPFPVLVVIHGGCWLAFADLQHLTPFAAEFAEAGIATWSLEYRRVDSPGGGWPNTFLDVAAGVDHLQSLAAEYDLDLDRVVVAGHSSGGHLALWLAGRKNIPSDSPLFTEQPLAVQAAVSLDGATVETEALRELDNKVCGGDVVDRLLGGPPEEVPDNWAAAALEDLLPYGTRIVLLPGGDHPILAPENLEIFAARVRESGDEVTIEPIEGSAHFDLIIPGTTAFPETREVILSLFE